MKKHYGNPKLSIDYSPILACIWRNVKRIEEELEKNNTGEGWEKPTEQKEFLKTNRSEENCVKEVERNGDTLKERDT